MKICGSVSSISPKIKSASVHISPLILSPENTRKYEYSRRRLGRIRSRTSTRRTCSLRILFRVRRIPSIVLVISPAGQSQVLNTKWFLRLRKDQRREVFAESYAVDVASRWDLHVADVLEGWKRDPRKVWVWWIKLGWVDGTYSSISPSTQIPPETLCKAGNSAFLSFGLSTMTRSPVMLSSFL